MNLHIRVYIIHFLILLYGCGRGSLDTQGGKDLYAGPGPAKGKEGVYACVYMYPYIDVGWQPVYTAACIIHYYTVCEVCTATHTEHPCSVFVSLRLTVTVVLN